MLNLSKEDIRTITFAAIVCVVCSVIISGAAASLRSMQTANAETDRRLNVLRAFGVDTVIDGKKLTREQVQKLFDAYIRELVIDAETGEPIKGLSISEVPPADIYVKKSKLAIYKWVENGEIKKVAFPLAGMGLWSTVYSYIALEDDFATIVGATFYGHKETPGLGGEVSSDWFMDQFAGKKVFTENGEPVEFEVVKGEVDSKYPNGNDHAVDGMSGATMTGNGVQAFINDGVERYNVYLKQLRNS